MQAHTYSGNIIWGDIREIKLFKRMWETKSICVVLKIICFEMLWYVYVYASAILLGILLQKVFEGYYLS